MRFQKTLKRVVASVVSAALLLGAPGTGAYQAAAQSLGRGAPVEVGPRSISPAVAAPGLNLPPAGVLAPSLGLAPGAAPSAAPSAAPFALPAPAALPAALMASPLASAPAALPRAAAPVAAPSAVRVAASAAVAGVARSASARSVSDRAPPSEVSRAAEESARLFDGAQARASSARAAFTPVAAAPSRRRSGFLRRVFAAVAVSVMALSPLPALGQTTATPNGKAAVAAQVQAAGNTAVPPPGVLGGAIQQQVQQAAPADSAQVALPRPVTASLSADRSDATVGERIHLTVVLRNASDKAVTVRDLRAALQDALPEDLELQGKGAEAPLTLAPGETKTVVYEAIPFASGEIAVKDAVATVAVDQTAAYPDGIEIVVPDTTVTVKSVLTPDWKQKGLRDIVGVVRAQGPNWAWIAGGALGFLLLIGIERVLAARRWYPKLDERRLSLVASTEDEIAALERGVETMDSAAFAAAVQETVTRFMVDFAGLPRRERAAKVLARDLKASKAFRPEQVAVAAGVAARAEDQRFSGETTDAASRLRDLARLRALVETVAGKAKTEAPQSRGGLNGVLAAGGASGLQFGSPWALLLFIPFGAYLWKAWRARGTGARFAVSSAAQSSSHRSLRERLSGLPRALRMSAISLLILAASAPMIGVQRLESYTPSTDTMIVEDRSGSMDGKMGSVTKIQAAADAIRAYVNVQREGTQNRVGMETFDDAPYVDVRLTTDYDALIAHLKEIKTGGSTAIGDGILTAVGHFAEVSILDLDGDTDARVAQMKTILRQKGLSAALEFAKPYPDLMQKVLHPERAKVVVVFTDGESNSGVDPSDAAKIAASLGVKVYTVGIGDSFDEATLRSVAAITKAGFYKAGDAEGMTKALLDIGRLEKSPAKVVSSVQLKDYAAFLALLAFLLLGAEATLGNTRLRTLQGLVLALSLQGAPLVNTLTPASFSGATPAAYSEVQSPAVASKPGTLSKVPEEMAEGNRLYAQGRYAEAVKKYAEAVAAHPDIPELYFNMADAYLRMGDAARAEQSFRKYLELTPDAVKQSQALFNLGNTALSKKDGEKAIEFYKEALRRDPDNQDAKWNLEALKQQQKEQQQNQQQSKKNQKGKKGKKGQQGKPGDQQGKPGDQKGQPGDSKGQPGDSKGDPKDASKDPKGDKDKGAEQLTQKLGDQQQKADEAARKAIARKGSGVWAALPLPLAGILGHGVAFAAPWALIATAVGVPLIAALIWYGLRRNARAARELSPGTAPKTVGAWWGLRRFLTKSGVVLLAAALVGLASTDPRGGATDQRVNFGGKDMIVAVDGSSSFVYAEDGRMDQAKKDLTRFIERLQGTDRVGLVVFAGQARTASPISIDYGNFEFKVNRLEYEARGLKSGSDLGAAITYAVKSFDVAKKIGDRQRILIVVSDGESFDSEIDAAIKAAKDAGVTVYTIGIGTAAGTRMVVPTEDGKGTEFIIDEKTGAPAVSHLEEAKLRRLAESTGGAYFHADKGASIDKVMQAVAEREKGRQGDTIKSPQPIGSYLIWPALALLLLDLLLPGRSLLRRDAPGAESSKKKKEKKGSGGAAGMMGAALVPLAAWPQILPFAVLAVAVSGLLAYDVWSGGALTRRVREAWQRRTGFIAKGVRSDLGRLYDPREADAPRLESFLARWQSAADKDRPALIAEASADEALWREKLTAAYLSGAAPQTHEAVLTALRRTSRSRLESLKPVVARLSARRGALSWLDHSDAAERLTALEETAAGQPFAVPQPASPAPSRRSFKTRFARTAVIALLALSTAVGGFSVDGTLRYAREQNAAEQAAFRIFYGDDVYVFGDRYVDERIPQMVLPAFRAWHKPLKDAGPDFERAMQILRESPDPKADNLLVVAFRRAALLPLDQAAETTMLKAMIERDSDALWASMDRTIAQSGDDAGQAALLGKLLVLGVESGNEHAFVNLFRILKAPNDQVRGQAFEVLYGSMTGADKAADFFPRLSAVNKAFAADPTLQMWTELFALRRAGAGDMTEMNGDQARAFVDQLLANAAAFDAARPPLFAAALAQAQQSGEKPQLPPSILAAELGLMGRFEAQARGQDAALPVPPALASLTRYAVNKSVTSLIQEAEKDFPGLHERLIQDGVALPDKQETQYDEYEGGGYSMSVKSYRELYKLSHLRTLQADLAEAAAAGAKNADPAKALAAAELGDRAGSILTASLEAGAAAGMLEGGSPAEKTAEALLPLLKDGVKAFSGSDFLTLLRARSLAPVVGEPTSDLAYPETIDAAQLDSLRGLFAEMAKSGALPGGGRALTWSEKRYAARALDAVDALRDPKAPAAAGFERPGQDAVALARLSVQIDAKAKDGAALLALEKEFLARVAGPQGASMSADDLKQVVPQLIKALDESGRGAESWKLLRAALDSGALTGDAKAALQPQAFESVKSLGEKLEKAFEGAGSKIVLMEADVKETDYAWRKEFTLRQYDALVAAARALAAAQKARPEGLSADQKAVVARVEAEMPGLKAFAVQLGVPAGDAAATDDANLHKALHLLYMRFPGTEFYDAMVKKGFALPGGYDQQKAWPKTYAKAQLQALRDDLQATLKSGTWTTADGTKTDLSQDEKDFLGVGIRAADHMLAAAPKGTTPLHGFAPLGLALAAGGLGPWAFAAIAAAVATWLIWKYAFRAPAAGLEEARTREASMEARRSRIAFAAQRLANSVVGGEFRSRFIGAGGSEFAEARPYQGEDYREIDWKTTAKKGETYAKKFELERDMPLILLVDVSGSGRFGTRGADKRAVIEDVAATLALAASRTNVRVGAILFSDRVEGVIPVRGGAKHTAALIDAVLNAKPAGKGTDLKPALDQVMGLSKSRAMVAVVSDFLAPDFKDALAAISSRYDLRAIRVVDPAETRPLPDVALLPLVDAESGASRTLDTGDKKVRSDAAAAIARREAKLDEDLLAARARPIVLSTEGDPLESLAAHFDPKARNTAP